VAGKTGVVLLNPDDVGLDQVENTSDADKPVSTAQAAALAGKANTSHSHATSDLTVAANIKSILDAANYAAVRTLLSLVVGTDVQAQSAILNTLAGMASDDATTLATLSADVQAMLDAATNADIRNAIGVTGSAALLEEARGSGSSLTAIASDKFKVVRLSSTGDRTYTIPQGVFAVGEFVYVLRKLTTGTAGKVSFVAGSGITLDSEGGVKDIVAEPGLAMAWCQATDYFVLSGPLG
jgi:hypothetical protein